MSLLKFLSAYMLCCQRIKSLTAVMLGVYQNPKLISQNAANDTQPVRNVCPLDFLEARILRK